MNEEKKIVSKLIDTSVWLAYLTKNRYASIIDSEETFLLSAISLFEIKKKFLKDNIAKADIVKNIGFIKNKSIIISLSEKTAEDAAELAHAKGLATADALIYASALKSNARLITIDNDFRGLAHVVFLEEKFE